MISSVELHLEIMLCFNLVAQELARQGPEGVEVEETARQVDELELLHLGVNEKLRGGERRSARPGGVGDIHTWKYEKQIHSLTFKGILLGSNLALLALYQFHKHMRFQCL